MSLGRSRMKLTAPQPEPKMTTRGLAVVLPKLRCGVPFVSVVFCGETCAAAALVTCTHKLTQVQSPCAETGARLAASLFLSMQVQSCFVLSFYAGQLITADALPRLSTCDAQRGRPRDACAYVGMPAAGTCAELDNVDASASCLSQLCRLQVCNYAPRLPTFVSTGALAAALHGQKASIEQRVVAGVVYAASIS